MADLGLEYVYGINAVAEMIKHNARSIEQVYLQSGRDDQRLAAIIGAARQAKIAIATVSKPELLALLSSSNNRDEYEVQNHQGVVASCRPSQSRDESFLDALVSRNDSPLLLLILEYKYLNMMANLLLQY